MHNRTPATTTTLLLLALCAGCAALPLPLELPFESDATVAGGTALEGALNDFQFSEFAALDVSQSESYQNAFVGRKTIRSARVTTLALRITDPPGQDFNFIEEMSFFVEAENLERRRIAHRQVPRNTNLVLFDIDPVDLKPYILADTMAITTEVRGRRPEQDTQIHSRLVLRVETALF